MKKFTLIFFVAVHIVAFSQTKQESEEWINQNINDYSVSYGSNPIKVVENIFIDGAFLYFYHHWKRNDENYYSGTWDKVALKDISSIEYSFDKSPDLDNKWIELNLNFKKGKCFAANADYEYQGKDDLSYQIQPDRTAVIMRLNMEFVESGMKKRIEKALLHIIKLYGGNAIVKKEPF